MYLIHKYSNENEQARNDHASYLNIMQKRRKICKQLLWSLNKFKLIQGCVWFYLLTVLFWSFYKPKKQKPKKSKKCFQWVLIKKSWLSKFQIQSLLYPLVEKKNVELFSFSGFSFNRIHFVHLQLSIVYFSKEATNWNSIVTNKSLWQEHQTFINYKDKSLGFF